MERQGLLRELPGDALAQADSGEAGNPLDQPGELLKGLKAGLDDLGQLVPGVADVDGRNEAVQHQPVAG
jgi:hypothetical protein